jgi:hypothetical protein
VEDSLTTSGFQAHRHILSMPVSTDSTSDNQSLLTSPAIPSGSFFTHHELRVKKIQPAVVEKYPPDWILPIVVFLFILLAWVQVFYHRRFRQLIIAPFSKRFLGQLLREGDLVSERMTIALGFIYLVTFALLILEVFGFSKPGIILPIHGLLMFGLVTAGLLLFWLLKIGLIRFLSFIFRTRQTTREYILNTIIFNLITGITLLPVLTICIYLHSGFVLWICVGLVILLFVFRFIRGFLIGISLTKFSYVFLFVYLCTLEILPLAMLLKVVLLYWIA